jgi:hypothetical protein
MGHILGGVGYRWCCGRCRCAKLNASAPGVWYTVIGDGGAVITVSTCAGTSFDTEISVFLLVLVVATN